MKPTDFLLVAASLCVMPTPAIAQTPPPPSGVWLAPDEGMVMRIEACGAAFCGYTAGRVATAERKEPSGRTPPACGTQLLFNFSWNAKSRRWEGKMRPPDVGRSLNATIETDGSTFLKVNARLLLLSKTLAFVPYTGALTNGCLAPDRLNLLLASTVSTPRAVARMLAPAVFAQVGNRPDDFGRTWNGFAQRAGGQFTRVATRELLLAGSTAALGRDPRYQPCECRGGWQRLGHALRGTVMLVDASGQHRLDPSHVLASYGAGYASVALFPPPATQSVAGYQVGTLLLGQRVVGTLAQEFGGDVRRMLSRTLHLH
jgi:uncharacterized protein (DUF2147 family)